MEALKEQGWDAIPEPQANFFWLPLGEGTEDAAAAFARQALAVRAFPGEGIRVSLGLPEANDRVLSVCRNLRSL
ncbi:truncated aminotransferase [Parascardovia denticolens DSM 10105 = JCM 12538]|nr:truncated aminotransferase [Parascardovia denticolens DSM 10105 = JCM 12538]